MPNLNILMFVAGWRHALRSEWTFIINNNNNRRLVTLAEHTSDHGRQTNSTFIITIIKYFDSHVHEHVRAADGLNFGN